MKKALVIILAIITVLVVAVSLIIFVPKIANEAKINKLSAGGVKLGEYTYSLNETFEGKINVTEDKVVFCYTQVQGQTDFVKEKEHLYIVGKYSVGLDKNITVDIEECYNMRELIGTEENIENYKQYHEKKYKEYLDDGRYTQQQYDREIALINGEKAYPINEKATPTSAKLRMDAENGKVYLMSFKNKYITVSYS